MNQNTQGTKNLTGYDLDMSPETATVAQTYFQRSVRLVEEGGKWYRYGNADGTGDQSIANRVRITGGSFRPDFVVRGICINDLDDDGRWVEVDLFDPPEHGCSHCRRRLLFGLDRPWNVTRVYFNQPAQTGEVEQWANDIVLWG